MVFLNKYANIRRLLIACFLCAFLSAAFWNFKTAAQPQISSADSNSNSTATASPAPSPSASPTPIPLSFIITEKQKTEKRLGEITKKITENAPVSRIQAELSELVKDSDARAQETNETLAASPSLQTLGKIEDYWSSLSLSLPSRKTRVQAQAAEIAAELTELQNIQAIWSLTKQSLEGNSTQASKETALKILPDGNTASLSADGAANKTIKTNANRIGNFNANVNANINANINAAVNTTNSIESSNASVFETPRNLKEQVSEILERIKQTQSLVQANLGELIKLQERLAENEKRTNEMRGKIAAARNVLLSNLVVRDSPPIWSGDSFEPGFRQEAKKSFAEQFGELRIYFAEHLGFFLLHLLIILSLILAFRWTRRKTRQLVEQEPKLKPALIIFEFPLASALILGLFFGPVFYQLAPDLLDLIASPLLLVAIFFLFRQLIEKPYVPILIALVALYLIDDVRLFTEPVALLSRLIFLGGMLGGIIFLAWLIRANNRRKVVADSGYSVIVKTVGIVLLFPFAFAFLANALGYVGLATVVGETIVSSLSFGLVLYALVTVADSLLIFAFRIPPFSKLMMVKSHPALIQVKIFKIFKWLAILLWLIVSLSQSYLFTPFFNLLEKILTYRIGIGTIGVSLGGILLIVLIIWFSFLLSRFLRFALEQDIYPRVHLASGLPYAASTILHYLLLLGGVFLALAAAGIDLTKFTIFLGALGVGVGIGLQNIVENFTSGLILLLERPVKVGDSIQMEQQQGELKHIGLRASIVKTYDGAEIIVPNGQLITQEVTNWTLSDHRRRLDINVGVEYAADPENVIRLLEETAKNHPETDLGLPPRALFLGFGDNSLDFQLRAWTANHENWVFIKSDITIGIYKTLKEANIKIPFPQRDLHIKSMDNVLANIDQVKRNKDKNNTEPYQEK